MCLLAMLYRAVDGAPLLVAANREEAYARGGTPPALWAEPRAVVAGVDPKAGGTWLGVNAHGLLVAVTNRKLSHPPERPRSRGLLVRDLLATPDALAAADHAARELSAGRYAGCNLVLADSRRALVILAGDWLRVRLLPPGAHAVTTHDLNDPNDPRGLFAREWLSRRPYADADAALADLRALCARSAEPAIVAHGPEGGTVSGCLLDLRESLAASRLWAADGPPDRTPYVERSELLRELTGQP
jgi:uncharacterized protein with NRDE domain